MTSDTTAPAAGPRTNKPVSTRSGDVIDYCLAGIAWAEINTYGLRRSEARDVKRIRLALPPVVDESLLFGAGDLLAGPQHFFRYLQFRQHRQKGNNQKHRPPRDKPASSVNPFARPRGTTRYCAVGPVKASHHSPEGVGVLPEPAVRFYAPSRKQPSGSSQTTWPSKAFASADIPAPRHDKIGAHDGWLRTRPHGDRPMSPASPRGIAGHDSTSPRRGIGDQPP